MCVLQAASFSHDWRIQMATGADTSRAPEAHVALVVRTGGTDVAGHGDRAGMIDIPERVLPGP